MAEPTPDPTLSELSEHAQTTRTTTFFDADLPDLLRAAAAFIEDEEPNVWVVSANHDGDGGLDEGWSVSVTEEHPDVIAGRTP
jgi:hypothetical protein